MIFLFLFYQAQLKWLPAMTAVLQSVTAPAEGEDSDDEDEDESLGPLIGKAPKVLLPQNVVVSARFDVDMTRDNRPVSGSSGFSFSDSNRTLNFPYGPIQAVSADICPSGVTTSITWSFVARSNTFLCGVIPDSKVKSGGAQMKETTAGCVIQDSSGGSDAGSPPRVDMRDKIVRVVANSLMQTCTFFVENRQVQELHIQSQHWPVRLCIAGYSGTVVSLRDDPHADITPPELITAALTSKKSKLKTDPSVAAPAGKSSQNIATYRVKGADVNRDGKFNIRTGLSISTTLVKTFGTGDLVDINMDTQTKNDEGDTRYRLADDSGWCTLVFRTGIELADFVCNKPVQTSVAATPTRPSTSSSPDTTANKTTRTHLQDVVEYSLTHAFVVSAQVLDVMRTCPFPFEATETTILSTVQAFLQALKDVALPESAWSPLYSNLIIRSLLMPRAALFYRGRFAARFQGQAKFSFMATVSQLEAITKMENYMASLMHFPKSDVRRLLNSVRQSLYSGLLKPSFVNFPVPTFIPACQAHVSDGLVRCLRAYVPMVVASTTRDLHRLQAKLRIAPDIVEISSQFRVLSADRRVAQALRARWIDLMYEVVLSQLLSATVPTDQVQRYATLMPGLLALLSLFRALAAALFDGRATFGERAIAKAFARAWASLPAPVLSDAAERMVAYLDHMLDTTSVDISGATLHPVSSGALSPSFFQAEPMAEARALVSLFSTAAASSASASVASTSTLLATGHTFFGLNWGALAHALQHIQADRTLSLNKGKFLPMSSPDQKAERLLQDACEVIVLLCAQPSVSSDEATTALQASSAPVVAPVTATAAAAPLKMHHPGRIGARPNGIGRSQADPILWQTDVERSGGQIGYTFQNFREGWRSTDSLDKIYGKFECVCFSGDLPLY